MKSARGPFRLLPIDRKPRAPFGSPFREIPTACGAILDRPRPPAARGLPRFHAIEFWDSTKRKNNEPKEFFRKAKRTAPRRSFPGVVSFRIDPSFVLIIPFVSYGPRAPTPAGKGCARPASRRRASWTLRRRHSENPYHAPGGLSRKCRFLSVRRPRRRAARPRCLRFPLFQACQTIIRSSNGRRLLAATPLLGPPPQGGRRKSAALEAASHCGKESPRPHSPSRDGHPSGRPMVGAGQGGGSLRHAPGARRREPRRPRAFADYSTSSTATVRPDRRWASEASMNGSRSPSSTSAGELETWPVRRSFTI
jgi:hypothetical protein